ncbi:MAG: hypothetical protein CL908_11085 [Deltaproteobacteria bacterium]|jgi:hypothetical protein|nr:hypothetical protein [Deltaproteobacteria bacterium]
MTSSNRTADATRSATDFVALLREFLDAHAALSAVLMSDACEAIPFESVRELVGDDDRAVLYRLKEKSHALFRSDAPGSHAVRREALFDLTIGSLFHEAMTLRESLYQREVYAPRVAELSEYADEESEALLDEFDRILERTLSRLTEVISEVRILLAQARGQLRRLLVEHSGERVVARCLLSRRRQVDAAFPEGFVGLLELMHGGTVRGLIEAARAQLESAYFVEAAKTLHEAAAHSNAPRAELDQLRLYTQGMQAILDGDYPTSILTLEAWADTGSHEVELDFAQLASSSLGRIGHLAGDDEAGSEIAANAKQLQLRLETARPLPGG